MHQTNGGRAVPIHPHTNIWGKHGGPEATLLGHINDKTGQRDLFSSHTTHPPPPWPRGVLAVARVAAARERDVLGGGDAGGDPQAGAHRQAAGSTEHGEADLPPLLTPPPSLHTPQGSAPLVGDLLRLVHRFRRVCSRAGSLK